MNFPHKTYSLRHRRSVDASNHLFSIIYSRTNSDIEYAPEQPVTFSHKIHSGKYKIKCLFCHQQAETQSFSALPSTLSCMVCHVALKSESKLIEPLMQSYDNNQPIKWIRIHKLPDYVKFNHNTHIMANIDCASCHGNIETMDITRRTKDFTMSWCLDCHRNPARHIIPGRKITGIFNFPLKYSNHIKIYNSKPKTKPEYGNYINQPVFEKYGIKATHLPGKGPENCSACHY